MNVFVTPLTTILLSLSPDETNRTAFAVGVTTDSADAAAPKLKEALAVAKEDKRSVLVHLVTKKGKGYAPAEKDPTKWHGIGPQRKGDAKGSVRTWSDAFGEALGFHTVTYDDTEGSRKLPRVRTFVNDAGAKDVLIATFASAEKNY